MRAPRRGLAATCCAAVLALGALAPASPAQEPSLPRLVLAPEGGGTEALSTDGTLVLEWTREEDDASLGASLTYELRETPEGSDPVVLDAGRHESIALSGRDDGTYLYAVRVRDGERTGPWSDPVRVRVQHHSMALALGLLAVGAAVFLATASVVVVGARRATRS